MSAVEGTCFIFARDHYSSWAEGDRPATVQQNHIRSYLVRCDNEPGDIKSQSITKVINKFETLTSGIFGVKGA